MNSVLGDPALWGQFGLPGLVIFALFLGGLIFIGWVVRYVNTLTKMHSAERKEWRQEMREDRKESTDAANKMSKAINDLQGVLEKMKP